MTKALEAFRTISEVAEELDVQKHVLRFWENKFPQVRPMKRGGGRRYYRPDDLDLLRGIRFLLHREGYTIKGVQKLLREQGLDFVKSCWQGQPGPPAAAAPTVPAKAGRKTSMSPAKPSPAQRPAAGGKAAAKAASQLLPTIAGLDRNEHMTRLKALVAELEECRRILRGSGTSATDARPQRAVK
jgi:DNA-binding transcriptional MerR regulator